MAFHFANINAVYYLLAAVILIITPVSFVNADSTKEYIVTLKSVTGNEAEVHYSWLKEEQGKTLVKANSVDADEASSNADALQTFSIGTWNAYAGEFSENWVEEVLRKRSEVNTIQLNGHMKLFAPIADQPVTVAPTVLNGLDMLDATGDNPAAFDGKVQFPSEAGEGVNVYVIDTGVHETHEEFEGRAKMVASVCKDCPKTDDHGHGTHVSGTIAGRNVGVAKKAKIFGIKVFTSDGQAETADILKGFQMVADAKKGNPKGIYVVNFSAGGPPDDGIDQAVKATTDIGVHVVVAAGNEAQDACNVSPAREPSAITVGAVEDFGLVNADFSNWGKCVDVFGPGVDVLSCGIQSDFDKLSDSGTSMATPHVVGVAALYLSKNGDMPADKLQAALTDKALKGKLKLLPGTESSPNLVISTKNL